MDARSGLEKRSFLPSCPRTGMAGSVKSVRGHSSSASDNDRSTRPGAYAHANLSSTHVPDDVHLISCDLQDIARPTYVLQTSRTRRCFLPRNPFYVLPTIYRSICVKQGRRRPLKNGRLTGPPKVGSRQLGCIVLSAARSERASETPAAASTDRPTERERMGWKVAVRKRHGTALLTGSLVLTMLSL